VYCVVASVWDIDASHESQQPPTPALTQQLTPSAAQLSEQRRCLQCTSLLLLLLTLSCFSLLSLSSFSLLSLSLSYFRSPHCLNVQKGCCATRIACCRARRRAKQSRTKYKTGTTPRCRKCASYCASVHANCHPTPRVRWSMRFKCPRPKHLITTNKRALYMIDLFLFYF